MIELNSTSLQLARLCESCTMLANLLIKHAEDPREVVGYANRLLGLSCSYPSVAELIPFATPAPDVNSSAKLRAIKQLATKDPEREAQPENSAVSDEDEEAAVASKNMSRVIRPPFRRPVLPKLQRNVLDTQEAQE